jgi:cell wall-associated NlpC family hydrolase
MLRVRQRYLVFAGRGLYAQFAFDETRVRGKLGQRPVAIMPGGEVLVMGLTGDDRFALTSCGSLSAPQSLCRPDAADLAEPTSSPLAAPAASATGLDASTIFARLAPVANLHWQADASALPPDCRAAEGCVVRGQAARFVPLTGLRLSRGLYRRTGMAYAQAADGLAAADRFSRAAADGAFTPALRHAREGRGALPGNLADGFTGDLGIDCSALIQLAWAGEDGRARLTTLRLQSGPIAYGCPSRLPGAGYLRAGDAIALNITGVLEHAVIFAEPVITDGGSEAWLVLEAASGCGGVCWSLYDPAFFNGWGLYRAAGRRDRPCPAAPATANLATAPIPRERAAWLRMLRGGR